jgi:ABC-type multidrug transport system permease subunit
MNTILLLVKKDLQTLLRSKKSALIVLFAPLLIILLLGLSYDTSGQFGLNIGVYAPEYSEDINEFINLLKDDEFSVLKYEENIDECVTDIKAGLIHTCLELPTSLQSDGINQKEVKFYVDPSKINLVWMIQNTVESKFNLKSQEISTNLGTNIINAIDKSKSTLDLELVKLEEASQKSTTASQSTTNIKSNLENLDLKFSYGGYDKTVLTKAKAQVTKGLKEVNEALDYYDNNNLSYATLRTSLKEAQTQFINANKALNDNTSSSISSLVSHLEHDINRAIEKLDLAKLAIDSSSSDLSQANTNLQEVSNSVNSIKEALNTVKADLEKQKATPQALASPIVTKIEKIGAGSYLDLLFPSLLVLVVMFGSMVLGTSLVMAEKTSPAFFRNYFLPLRKITFITATYLTNIILTIFQLSIILIISLFFLSESISKFPSIFLVLFLVSSVFTLIGMILGYVFSSEETAVLASVSLGSLFLFFSGMILPIEGISKIVRNIIAFNPFVIAERLIRGFFLFDVAFTKVAADLAILTGYIIALFLLTLILESVLHKHLIQRFVKKHQKARKKKNLKKIAKKNNDAKDFKH